MPEPGRSERIALLRAAVARIQTGGMAGGSLPPLAEALPGDGFLSPRPASFYEIAPANGGDCGAATGFALGIAGRLVRAMRRPLLWVVEDFAIAEQGAPYPPGLAAYGIGLHDFILIRAGNRLDLWRVMEEAIRSRAFAAIIGEPAALGGRDLPSLIRRLALAARSHRTCAILLRPASRAPFLAPSPLRFEVATKASAPAPGFVLARPLPGSPLWTVLYRGAAGLLPGFDPDKSFEAGLETGEASPTVVKERSRAALPVRMHRAA